MSWMTAMLRWLGVIEHATVDEIMRPLTRIHDALEARMHAAQDAHRAAHSRAAALLDEAHAHTVVAAAAREAQAKLASLLP